MKTIFICLLSLLLSWMSHAQARIGSTEWQIRADFSNELFESGKTDEGIPWIAWNDGRISVFYAFNEAGYCFRTVIFPANTAVMHGYIEMYNQKYVIVSDTHWKIYSSGGVLNIFLEFNDEGMGYFIIE